ncbi:MAG: hypothetical protein JSS75_07375 [Bacteroidetes bacterium]|nr:hypothetical protein [Bacteroidota bacterium]
MDNQKEIQINTYAVTTPTLKVEDVLAHVRLIDQVKKSVMKENVHYGKVPGTKKDSLYKPGSDKLLIVFRIRAEHQIEDLSTDGEYRVRVTSNGFHIGNGNPVGQGVGECSSAEEKYKWRVAICDEEYDSTPENLRRIKFAKDKDGDVYQVKQIRTQIADTRNTVVKMAIKRADAALALAISGASDIFDQDTDDPDFTPANQQSTATKRKPEGPYGLFVIVGVSRKEGSTNGRGWTRFTINAENAETKEKMSFGTISQKLGEEAEGMKGTGAIAEIVWEKTKYGNDLKSIKQAPPEQKDPQPANPTPQQGNLDDEIESAFPRH